MISESNKQILIKRFKSFVWRMGGMAVAFSLQFVLENIGLLDLPPYMVVVLGGVIGEITKQLNNKAK